MSQTTINFTLTGGDVTQITAVTLSDPAAAYGVERLDTGAVVVAAGTAMTYVSPGVYAYTFTDPAPALQYRAYVAWTYRGITSYQEVLKTGGGDLLPRYLQTTDAAALAPSLLPLPAFAAATTTQQSAALTAASADIDRAMRYQGRKLHRLQQLEFPRLPYFERFGAFGDLWPQDWPDDWWADCPFSDGWTDVIWDFDPVSKTIIVPLKVQQACLYQANDILDGSRAATIEKLAMGLSGQSIGTAHESYDAKLGRAAAVSGLCRRAQSLMQFYELRTGQML